MHNSAGLGPVHGVLRHVRAGLGAPKQREPREVLLESGFRNVEVDQLMAAGVVR